MKNISMFKGIVEFVSPNGKSYLFDATNKGIYEKDSDGQWVYLKPYHGKSKSPSSILRSINS